MNRTSDGRLQDAIRSWLSVWLVIHFFALVLSLLTSVGTSDAERRLLRVLAPYVVGLHQDYARAPLQMTRGQEVDFQHVLQFHLSSAAADAWQVIGPPTGPLSRLDLRWSALERHLARAAAAENEDLLHLIYEQAIVRLSQEDGHAVDGIRLARHATLSYEDDEAQRAGELRESALDDEILFECRVVELSPGRFKLIPVLEATRRAKSLLGQIGNALPSEATSAQASAVEVNAARANAAEASTKAASGSSPARTGDSNR